MTEERTFCLSSSGCNALNQAFCPPRRRVFGQDQGCPARRRKISIGWWRFGKRAVAMRRGGIDTAAMHNKKIDVSAVSKR